MKNNAYHPVQYGLQKILVAIAETAVACLPATGLAQIVPTPGTGTHVVDTPNGLPQVNVARPSGAGVSVNGYSQFDVQKAGAILNNSPVIVNTQQAGMINGNPNFDPGQSARIIVNQVNSANPSMLRGFAEVAGNRAEVILANPSGIVVDGGGFINTSRATLTTGQPYYGADGSLAGFNVSRGFVTVQGDGLNAANVDQVDLIARTIQANAVIHAKRLDVIAGANRVDHATLTATAIAGEGPAPSMAIDIGHLGGMYANRIRLIGTERGVGVSHAGVLAAQAGDLILQSNGRLVLSGKTNADGDLTLASSEGIDHRGKTYGKQNVTLRTDGLLTHGGTLAARSDLDVNAGTIDSTGILAAGLGNDGKLDDGGNLTVAGAGNVSAIGKNVAGGHANLSGSSVSLAGSSTAANGSLTLTASSGDIDVSKATTSAGGALVAIAARKLMNDGGKLIGANGVKVDAGHIGNVGGAMISGRDLVARAESLDNGAGLLSAKEAVSASVAGAIGNVRGTIRSLAAMSLSSGGALANASGRIQSGTGAGDDASGLEIRAGTVDNAEGLISHLGSGKASVHGLDHIVNRNGVMTSRAAMAVHAPVLVNTAGGQLSAADLTLRGGSLDNTGGRIGNIVSGKVADISAATGKTPVRDTHDGHIPTGSGKTTAHGDITLAMTGSVTNANGTIAATRNLSIDTFALSGGGMFGAATDLAILMKGSFTATPSYLFEAGRDLTFTLPGTFSNNGRLLARHDLTIDAGQITNSGAATAGNLLRTRSATLLNRGSMVGRSVSLAAARRFANLGPTALIGASDSAGILEILAPDIVNRDDATATDTQARTAIVGSGKVILAGSKTDAGEYRKAASIRNESALLQSGSDMVLSAAQLRNTRRVMQTSGYTDQVDPALLEARGISMSGRTGQKGLMDPDSIGGVYVKPPGGGQWNSIYEFTSYEGKAVANTVNAISPAAQIVSGGKIDASQVAAMKNYWSNVSAAGNVAMPAQYDADGWRASGQHAPTVKVTYSGQYHYNNYDDTEHDWQMPFGDAPFVGSRPGGYTQRSPADVRVYALPDYASTFVSNGTISGNGTRVDNTADNARLPALGLPPGQSLTDDAAGRIDPVLSGATAGNVLRNLTVPQGGLFMPSRAPHAAYLIETNPAFTEYRRFLSSDYFFKAIGVDLTPLQKRLGDGFYEQQLVRNQITSLTGKAVLGPYADVESMYESLMGAGAALSKSLGLGLGMSLSADQIARLKTNVVLMETRVVDGNVVLVPVVYLAKTSQQDWKGPLIAAKNIDLKNTRTFVNSGTVKAGNALSIDGQTIDNAFGSLVSGGAMALTAGRDIDLTSATLKAGSLQLQAGGDLILDTATETVRQVSDTGASRVNTTVGPRASIRVDGDATVKTGGDFRQNAADFSVGNNVGLQIDGSWKIGARQTGERKTVERANGVSDTDINRIIGSTVKVGGRSTIDVGGDLTARGADIDLRDGGTISAKGTIFLGTARATSTSRSNSSGGDHNGEYAERMTRVDETLSGTVLNAGNSINIESGKDITLQGSALSLDKGHAALKAAGDVNVLAADEKQGFKSDETHSRNGVLSDSDIASDIDQTATSSRGSMISADGITLSSKRDINVQGSQIVGTGDVILRARRDVNIGTSQDTVQSATYYAKKDSGILSNGGLSMSFGSRSRSEGQNVSSVTNNSSAIGSLKGDLIIDAGKAMHATGSVLHASNDLKINGQTVKIDSAYDILRQEGREQYRQSGLTLGFSNPVLAAIQTAQQVASAAKRTKGDPRLMALAAATTGLAVKNAFDGAGTATAWEAATSYGISLSLGASKSDSESRSEASAAVGSRVSAGRHVKIVAAGAGRESNIDVIGSRVASGGDTTLDAEGNVNLQAAKSTSSQHSKTSGGSASVGIALTVGKKSGLSFTLGVAGNRGGADGESISWTDTGVSAGNVLRIRSGADTTLRGAVASAKRVMVDAGGNLNVESLQDTDYFDSTQRNAGVNLSVCVPPLCYGTPVSGSANYSQQKIRSDFATAQERSGVRAGDGGFQIKVAGNTDLKGGLIESSDEAVRKGRNRLTTATLTHSDIENRADYKASRLSLSGGRGFVGKDKDGKATSGNPVPKTDQSSSDGLVVGMPVALSASGRSSSMTRSAISGGVLKITDDAKQQGLTGQTAAEAVASINRDTSETGAPLKAIFDKEKIEAGFEITGQLLNQVETFVNKRAAESDAAKKRAADPRLSPEMRAEAQQDADRLTAQWGPGGSHRRVLSALTAAAGGNVTGGVGQMAVGAAVNYVQGMAASKVKQIADKMQSETARAALHAIVGCAGAAASSQRCGAGAMGAATSSVLGSLMGSTEGLTAKEKEAQSNLVTSLVSAIAAAGGLDTGTAANAAATEGLNNRQLNSQEYGAAKKYAAVVAEKLGISVEQAEGRLVAELLRNSDKQTSEATDGKQDYELRSIVGCQNLNCRASRDDANYADHHFNSDGIKKNQRSYDLGQGQIGAGLTDAEFRQKNLVYERTGKLAMAATACVLSGGAACKGAAWGLVLPGAAAFLYSKPFTTAGLVLGLYGGAIGGIYGENLARWAGPGQSWLSKKVSGVAAGAPSFAGGKIGVPIGDSVSNGISIDPIFDPKTNSWWGYKNVSKKLEDFNK